MLAVNSLAHAPRAMNLPPFLFGNRSTHTGFYFLFMIHAFASPQAALAEFWSTHLFSFKVK